MGSGLGTFEIATSFYTGGGAHEPQKHRRIYSSMNLQIKNSPRELGVWAHAYNLNTQESEAGTLKI